MQTHTNLAREDDAKNALPSPEFVQRIGQWTSFSLQFGSRSVNFSTDHIRISSKSIALIKRIGTNHIKRAIGQRSNFFYVCQFGAKSIPV